VLDHYEKRNERLLSFSSFAWRLLRSFLVTLVIIAVSLIVGTAGYCYFGQLAWDDALLNAAMILTGMGPVNPMPSTPAKLFSAFYALYSGLTFLTMIAIIIAPIYHRFLHHFHLDEEDYGK